MKIDWLAYNRILKGKKDKNQLEPSDRYASIGGGSRLVSLIVRNDGSIPEEAYDGFELCSLIKPDLKDDDSHYAVVRINPKNVNNIFVPDYEAGTSTV